MDLTLSRTLRKGRDTGSGRPLRGTFLYRLIDAAAPCAGSSRHELSSIDEVVLGRGPRWSFERGIAQGTRRLTLRIPDGYASAEHARLHRRGADYVLTDLGSTNGTYVGGVAIDEARLTDGAVIEVGQTFFLLRTGVSMSAADPHDLDVAEAGASHGLLTLIPRLLASFDALAQVATSSITVAISGPTGAGKELLARAVHVASGRPGAFVPVNCGALPRTLVEAELFGHRRGAFTGAAEDRPGLVAAAERGTLFLDEIAELPLDSQAALLRVLQEREVRAVGATRATPVDLRVVSATHQGLDALVVAGSFREDLAARLAGYRFALPPLRERREDLGILIAAILREVAPAARFTDAAVRALVGHDWPRNVRERRHALEAAAALATDGLIDTRHLAGLAAADPEPVAAAADDPRHAELEALARKHQGNVSKIARELGKARTQVQRWIRRYKIDVERYR